MLDELFFEEYKKVTQKLSSILEIDIDNSPKMSLGLIGLYYDNLEQSIEKEEIKRANYSLEKLKRLMAELMLAKAFFENKKDDFLTIVRNLISDEPSNSFGARAELMMLNMLLEDYCNDPDFTLDSISKRESPDYEVITSGGMVFLEVSHTHVIKSKSKGAGYKITKAINAKAEKPYANRETALFLDITNIVHHETKARRSSNDLRSRAEKTLKQSRLGGVVLMYSLFNQLGRYQPFYFTIIHEEAPVALKDFLTRYYPNIPDNSGQRLFSMPTM